MELILDPDVNKVIEFMAREVRGDKLLFVARAVAQVAELAWSDAIPRPHKAVSMALEVNPGASASRARLAAT